MRSSRIIRGQRHDIEDSEWMEMSAYHLQGADDCDAGFPVSMSMPGPDDSCATSLECR